MTKNTESAGDAGNVEPGGEIIKVTLVSENCPQLATEARLHKEVYVLPVFEGPVQPKGKVNVTSGFPSISGFIQIYLAMY